MDLLKISFALLIGILLPSSLFSQVYVHPSGGDAAPYASWANAATDLQAAINYADANGIAEVWVAAGTYTRTGTDTYSLKNGITVYGGFPDAGNPVFADRDYTTHISTLSGENARRIIHHNNDGTDATAVLDGFTLIEGQLSGQHGGAIALERVSPTIRNCTFTNNTAPDSRDGGAIWFDGDLTASIENCTFTNNTATDDGGAVNIGGTNGCSPVFTNCTFTGNNAGDEGGAVRVWQGQPQFINCTMDANTANDRGGGIYANNGAASFSGCTITNNNAANYGGGICFDGDTHTVATSTVNNNQAGNDGGGVYLNNGGSSLSNTTIDGNTSTDDGGGIYVNNGAHTFNNLTVSNNVAGDMGGGVLVNNGASNITNCLIDANQSDDDGAGIYMRNSASPTLSGTTVSNNTITGANNHGGGICIQGNAAPNINNCVIDSNTATRDGGGIFASSGAWSVTFDGNTVINNTCIGSGGNYRGRGAGLYLEDSAPPITNNTFSGNRAEANSANVHNGNGGAIAINGQNPQILNNQFQNNTAISTSSGDDCGRGGAIYFMSSASVLSGNTFDGNQGAFGGAIYTFNSDIDMSSNTYTNNAAMAYKDDSGYGGAVVFDGNNATGSVLTTETFDSNTANPGLYASSGWGGAVYFTGGGINATISQSSFVTNTADFGGAFCIDNGADPVLNRLSINQNTASTGGGAFYYNGDSDMQITNSLIYSNDAPDGGAAYYANFSSPLLDFNNVYADNTGTNGTAIFCNESDPTFTNNIFWNNTIHLDNGGADPYFDYCNVEGGTAAFTGGGAGGYNAGRFSNCIDADPQFSDGVYHITLGTSPCIGAGNPGTATGDFPADEDYDAEKRVRGTVDIGAYETNNTPQFVTLPYPPVTDNPGPVNVIMDEDGAPTPFSLTLNAIDLDDENLEWTIPTQASNGTAGITSSPTVPPNEHSQTITYTPDADFFGTDNFIIQISDGTLIDQITVDVTINPINDAPVFTSTPATTSIKAGKTWTYNISTSDVDHASSDLTVTALTLPAGMTFTPGANGTGTLSWTPGDADLGGHNISLQVEDTGMPIETATQNFTFTVLSRFINIPADYPTIQQGINAAEDGDKIIVAAGTYYENINTQGKSIEIEGDPANPAAVVVDAGGSGPALTIDQGGAPFVDGFTFTNGTGQLGQATAFTLHAPNSAYYGGGVYIYNSNPTLKNIHVKNNSLAVNNNHGGSGAGIYIGNVSTVVIEGPNTEISGNTVETYRGGGICVDDSDLTIDGTVANGVLIDSNSAGNYGGGIGVYNSVLNLTRTSITGNTASGNNGRGGGIYDHTSTVSKNAGVSVSGNSASTAGAEEFSFH